MTKPNPRVDAFVVRSQAWQGEMRKLRTILLGCGLDEDIKWGKPCFTVNGKNVAIIQPFKAHCALMFFKGVLLKDTHGLLRSQGANSQSALRLEFRSEAEVKKAAIKSYVAQAIAVEKSGVTIERKAERKPELPAELTAVLRRDRALAQAFDRLTPGRKRSYLLHIASAKRPETRTARTLKCAPKMRAGLGFNERPTQQIRRR